jgi:hypothetical protein
VASPIDQTPTLAGFQDFITNVMQIDSTNLPPDSVIIPIAFQLALDIVNQTLQRVNCDIYTFAVYNLAASNLINWAHDIPNGTYFANLRAKWKIDAFAAGVLTSSSDQSTSSTLLNPEQMKELTMMNLQQLKDSYGRTYLGFAQIVGTQLFGIT